MEYADKLGIDFLAKHRQTLEQALTPNYQAILDAYFARRTGAETLRRPRPCWRRRNFWMMMPHETEQPESIAPTSPPQPNQARTRR